MGFCLQLEEARQQGTSGPGNDAELPLRPLVEILREAKEKKEEDFQAQWRQMKQGETLMTPLAYSEPSSAGSSLAICLFKPPGAPCHATQGCFGWASLGHLERPLSQVASCTQENLLNKYHKELNLLLIQRCCRALTGSCVTSTSILLRDVVPPSIAISILLCLHESSDVPMVAKVLELSFLTMSS